MCVHLCVMGAHGSVASQRASRVAVTRVRERVVLDLVVPRLHQLKDRPVPVRRQRQLSWVRVGVMDGVREGKWQRSCEAGVEGENSLREEFYGSKTNTDSTSKSLFVCFTAVRLVMKSWPPSCDQTLLFANYSQTFAEQQKGPLGSENENWCKISSGIHQSLSVFGAHHKKPSAGGFRSSVKI